MENKDCGLYRTGMCREGSRGWRERRRRRRRRRRKYIKYWTFLIRCYFVHQLLLMFVQLLLTGASKHDYTDLLHEHFLKNDFCSKPRSFFELLYSTIYIACGLID
jgi:hypothetical protein